MVHDLSAGDLQGSPSLPGSPHARHTPPAQTFCAPGQAAALPAAQAHRTNGGATHAAEALAATHWDAATTLPGPHAKHATGADGQLFAQSGTHVPVAAHRAVPGAHCGGCPGPASTLGEGVPASAGGGAPASAGDGEPASADGGAPASAAGVEPGVSGPVDPITTTPEPPSSRLAPAPPALPAPDADGSSGPSGTPIVPDASTPQAAMTSPRSGVQHARAALDPYFVVERRITSRLESIHPTTQDACRRISWRKDAQCGAVGDAPGKRRGRLRGLNW